MDHLFAAGVPPRRFKREGLRRRAEVVEGTARGRTSSGESHGERKGSVQAVEQEV